MTTSSHALSTSLSLIRRVQGMDSESWSVLVRLYGPLIYSWARRSGLQSQDASDLVQSVFISVWRGLPQFICDRKDASFRGWLRTITTNAIRARFRREKSRAEHVIAPEILALSPNPYESSDDDETLFSELPQRALSLVRESVDNSTWQAFWQVTMEDIPVCDVAQQFGLSEAAIRQAKYRVLCRLRAILSDR